MIKLTPARFFINLIPVSLYRNLRDKNDERFFLCIFISCFFNIILRIHFKILLISFFYHGKLQACQYSKIFRLYVRYLTNDSKIFHVFRSCNVTRRNSMYFLMMIDPVSLGLSLVSTEKIFMHIIPG